jgi:ATP-dependent helicase/nuclease subunit B
MTGEARPTLFTIAPGTAFLPALVRSILEGRLFPGHAAAHDPLGLSKWTILLPTRRAVRACREAFVELDPGTARMLPLIRALGDVDEDELNITGAYGAGASVELDLTTAASQPYRQFLLARLVQDWARANPAGPAAQAVNESVTHALQMAASLVQLIDSLETGEIDIAELPTRLAADPDLPMHRSEAIDFLALIARDYPEAMSAAGMMGPQARRSALLKAETARLQSHPCAGPVIAAGSTGSVPATAGLLKAISHLPEGAVVLPGLDHELDDPSWDQIEDQHPQFGMKELLENIGAARSDVQELPGIHVDDMARARAKLASQIMRPSESTHLWKDLSGCKAAFETACAGLSELVCPEMREQAVMIALIMREAHEEGRDCSLITPDRQLARRVSSELLRWNINVDDSAGEPLAGLPQGVFFSLVASVCAPDARAHDVVALLGQALLSRQLVAGQDTRQLARLLEVAVFRPLHGGHHVEGLKERIAIAHKKAADTFAHRLVKDMTSDDWQAIESLAECLEQAIKSLLELTKQNEPASFAALLTAHITVAEALCRGVEPEADRLWAGEAGAALSDTLRELLEEASHAPAMRYTDYREFIANALRSVPVRRRYPLHPKLRILGLLEARLVQSELVILGGLNEGTWPGEMDPGPWLSRPQHKLAGLQMPERRLGLAAHDFVQGLGASRVIMTWARKVGGTPAVASRWLFRLKAVLEAAGLKDAIKPKLREDWAGWALGLDWYKDMPRDNLPGAASAPVPKPPSVARPGYYSVSRVEKLIHDPYAVYADAVLKLKPLDQLDTEPGAAERGQLVHAIVETFCKQYPGAMPENAEEILQDIAIRLIPEYAPDPALCALWLPQVRRMMVWFCELETELRHNIAQQHTELRGEQSFMVGDREISLTARADRIDQLDTGGLRIVDYKTGAGKLMSHTRKGYKPQLYLEGWIAREGGFTGLPASAVDELMYIRLSGGDPPGETNTGTKGLDISQEIEDAAGGVQRLVSAYLDEAQGFPAKAGQEAWNRKSDYDHLSRWREWGMGSTDDTDEGEGG